MSPPGRGGAEPEALLSVWLQPGASAERVVGRMGDAVKIAVTAPPEKGKANAALEKLLAAEFDLSSGAVEVVAGGASRRKTVRLRGISRERLAQWIAAHTQEGK